MDLPKLKGGPKQHELTSKVYDFRSILNRHNNGYFIARVVVGMMKKNDKKEVMILIDPCLTNHDDTEPVVHFAVVGDRLEHRANGEFRKIGQIATTDQAQSVHLVQVAVGTWEHQPTVNLVQQCKCHPSFYESDIDHTVYEHCEMRLLAGHIATHLRMDGDLATLIVPSGLSVLN